MKAAAVSAPSLPGILSPFPTHGRRCPFGSATVRRHRGRGHERPLRRPARRSGRPAPACSRMNRACESSLSSPALQAHLSSRPSHRRPPRPPRSLRTVALIDQLEALTATPAPSSPRWSNTSAGTRVSETCPVTTYPRSAPPGKFLAGNRRFSTGPSVPASADIGPGPAVPRRLAATTCARVLPSRALM